MQANPQILQVGTKTQILSDPECAMAVLFSTYSTIIYIPVF